jgi:hypothetical protein
VNKDVTRIGVITTFHERRVLSLMWQARLLDEMVPNAPLKGTVLVMEGLDHEKIKKRIKSVLGSVPSTPPSTSTHRCVLMMASSRW